MGMATDEFTPELSRLEKDYQLLTELHGDGESRTYLARHLKLNRDVTITVVRSPVAEDGNALAHFASDARLLMTTRHPNVVPVIAGLWLDDSTFAIVRARVRGSTADELIRASGPIPVVRVAATVRKASEAIAWARSAGVVHRNVSTREVVFQQGSGRILLSFVPGPVP